MTAPGISIFRFDGDKIQAGDTVWDVLGTLQQLGVIPALEAAG